MKFPSINELDTGTKKSEWYISKHFPEFKEYVDSTYSFGESWLERLYCYFNGIVERPKCPICGSDVKFHGYKYGYARYCSSQCANSSPDSLSKKEKTCVERYGAKNVSQCSRVRSKFQATLKEKYGVDATSAFCIESVREKSKKTLNEHYGVDNPMAAVEIKQRAEETCLQRYGVRHSIISEGVKEKTRQTKLRKYGDIHYCNREQMKTTCIAKYGGNSPFSSEVVREKAKGSFLEKYGVPTPWLVPEIQEKARATLKEKYGADNAAELLTDEDRERIRQTVLKRYGVEYFCLDPRCNKKSYSSKSRPNLKFAKLLQDVDIQYDTEFVISNKRYDFKVGDILIEIDPYPTHNSTWGIHGNPTSKSYHYDKTNLATTNGYRCIHVWDWDDQNKIIASLLKKTKVSARKCEIKSLPKAECDVFLSQYHIQSTCKGQTYRYGLYFNGELIQVMTFGTPRYNKSCQYELLRLCTKPGYLIIGGSKRLFSKFIKDVAPTSIVSYCDLSKFTGHVYLDLGFVLAKQNPPSKHWYNGKMHITNNLLNQRGFDQLFGTTYGKGCSNQELMLMHKFVEIYDCGQATYVWKNNEKKRKDH